MKPDIKINCHSSICINNSIFVDPFNIKSGHNDAKMIFITHSHYDHLDLDSIEKIANDKTIFVGPIDVLEKLPAKYKNKELAKIDENSHGTDILCSCFPAYNLNKAFHPRDNNWVGYILNIDGTRIAVCGDTDATPELLSLRCDVLLIPVGGTYTMNYKEAASATNTIKPKIVIPIHYGSVVGKKSDGEDFKRLVDKDIECLLLI